MGQTHGSGRIDDGTVNENEDELFPFFFIAVFVVLIVFGAFALSGGFDGEASATSVTSTTPEIVSVPLNQQDSPVMVEILGGGTRVIYGVDLPDGTHCKVIVARGVDPAMSCDFSQRDINVTDKGVTE